MRLSTFEFPFGHDSAGGLYLLFFNPKILPLGITKTFNGDFRTCLPLGKVDRFHKRCHFCLKYVETFVK